MAPCLLPKNSGIEVTPCVTSVESSEQFWCKIRQIWRICEPCLFSAIKYIHYSADDIILRTISGAYSKNTHMYATFFIQLLGLVLRFLCLGLIFVKLITFITAVKFGYVEHWAQYLI